MADTSVEGGILTFFDELGWQWGGYFSDISKGVSFSIDVQQDLQLHYTDDKGATWTTTEIVAGQVTCMAAWFDQETPGDSGTLVHIAWMDAADDKVYYVTFDIDANSLGTIRTVDAGVTIDNTINGNRIGICKTGNGNIIVAFKTQAEFDTYKSSDNFATAGTSIANPFESGAGVVDFLMLFDANVDAGDAAAVYWDLSANELSVKMYDDSADTWTETSIATSLTDDGVYPNFDGSIRHSDSKLILGAHSAFDTTGDDLLTFEIALDSIASPTVTAKTNIFTNQAASAVVSVHINQQNDDVRIAYCKGGTWKVAVDVVFHLSDDDLATWEAEEAYSEQAADDFRMIGSGRTTGNDGGRYQPIWHDDDQTELYVNETNDVEIAAAGGPAGQPTQHRTQGIPTGSGFSDRPGRWN